MPVFIMTAPKPTVPCSGVSSFILTEKKKLKPLWNPLHSYDTIRYDTNDMI